MKKIIDKNEYFVSPDLSLIACLCCFGYTIEKIEHQGPKAYFYLQKDEEIDELVKKFWSHELKVNALSYFNFLKEIKSRIFNNN